MAMMLATAVNAAPTGSPKRGSTWVGEPPPDEIANQVLLHRLR